jgi:fatty-acid desaturase
MGTRDFQLVVLAAASVFLCAVAVMYQQRLATVIFAALTSGIIGIVAGLHRRHR